MRKGLAFVISIILILVIVTPVVFVYVLNNGNPYTKYLANKHVPLYLEEKGYREVDIEDAHYVEPKHVINREFYQGHYMVIFKDEPNVTYYYGINKKEKLVKQFCEKDILSSDGVTDLSEEKTKHSEKDCSNSL